MGLSYTFWVYLSVLLISILVIHLVAVRLQSPNKLPFLPGPPRLPLIGNLHQISNAGTFLTFTEWSRTYGSRSDGVIGLHVGPKAKMVVLSKWQHVRDLLDARGAIYSDRPPMWLSHFIHDDYNMSVLRYGPKWRRQRRDLTSMMLRDADVDNLILPVQSAESTQMLAELLSLSETPANAKQGVDCSNTVLRAFMAVIAAVVFGVRGKTLVDGDWWHTLFGIEHEFARALITGQMPPLEIFPWLEHVPDIFAFLPWHGWRARAQSLKDRSQSKHMQLLHETRARLRAGTNTDAFLARLVEGADSGKGSDYPELELAGIGAVMILGGVDTSQATLLSLILAFSAHPHILRRAQEEVDGVFDEDTLPHTANDDNLPFVKACYLEILRWRPTLTMSLPHAVTRDDVYNGYHIPKGSTVLMNTWAINRDPSEFANPDAFDPSRFVGSEFGTIPSVSSDKEAAAAGPKIDNAGDETNKTGTGGRRPAYVFGAGRRVCPGQRMAKNGLTLAIAKVVWAFDILPPEGVRPEQVDTDPRTAYMESLLFAPNKFRVRLRVRSERKAAVIREEWAKADAFLRERFE